MAIDTFRKRQASHRFGHGPTTRRAAYPITEFLRATGLGLYAQDVVLIPPSDSPGSGWKFADPVRTLEFGSAHRVLRSWSGDRTLEFGSSDQAWRFDS